MRRGPGRIVARAPFELRLGPRADRNGKSEKAEKARHEKTTKRTKRGCAQNLWVGIDDFFFFLHNLNACRTFRNRGNTCLLPSNGSSKGETPCTNDCRPSETSAPERSRRACSRW